MGDDQIGGFDQGLHPGNVDRLAGHHGVRDASQPRDVGGNGDTWLLQSAINTGDIADVSSRVEAEGDNPNLDDLVLASIETSCLGIDNDAAHWKAGPRRICDGTRLQLPQNAIATRLFKPAGHLDFVRDASHIVCGRRLGFPFRLPHLPRSKQVELLLHATYLALAGA